MWAASDLIQAENALWSGEWVYFALFLPEEKVRLGEKCSVTVTQTGSLVINPQAIRIQNLGCFVDSKKVIHRRSKAAD